jgi:hypothetical protein
LDVDEHTTATLLDEVLGDRGADATGGAGHHRDLTVQST